MEPRNASNSARLGFRVQNAAASREADIDIFDVIGDPWDGTTAKDFVQELRSLDADRINLHINSPGGYVNDGLAMYNAIQQHSAEVVAFIESQASSAASFVAMAADKVVIAKNAKMFIHDAQGFGLGNAADFRSLADMLDEESANIAAIYDAKAGGGVQKWRDAMQSDNGFGTTYRGQAAVDAGLADEVMSVPNKNVEPMRAVAHAPEPKNEDAEYDLSAIKTAGRRPTPALRSLESLLSALPLKEAVQAGSSSANGGNNG